MKRIERMLIKGGRFVSKVGIVLAWPGLALVDLGDYINSEGHIRRGKRIDAEMKAAPPSTFIKATRVE